MEWLLELKNISKSFGPCRALHDLSLKIKKGEILGFIGENGAGKSTAMNIVFGLYPPTSGEIYWKGQKLELTSPIEAKKLGIGMVHQHFMLSPTHTVLENVLLTVLNHPLKIFDKDQIQKTLNGKALELGFKNISWNRPIEELSVGEQQQIEIFKALLFNPELLILDEPTAVLTPQEVKSFFQQIKKLSHSGTAIIIITHKLKEILAFTDRVYVVRHGKNITEARTSETNIESLASDMVGHRLTSSKKSSSTSKHLGPVTLQVTNLEVKKLDQELDIGSFTVHQHEIVGIAGVEGNGQDLFISSLIEPKNNKITTGRITFDGNEIQNLTTSKIMDLGLRVLPEDRLRFGVLKEKSALENFILGNQNSFKKSCWLNWKQAAQVAAKIFEKFDVRPLSLELPLQNFSGGNQQKIVVARELLNSPRMLIAAHPTRGVDLYASSFIRDQIRKVSEHGSVVIISSDLDELYDLCDRLIVFYKGQIVAEFQKSNFNDEKIGAAMAGVPS